MYNEFNFFLLYLFENGNFVAVVLFTVNLIAVETRYANENKIIYYNKEIE